MNYQKMSKAELIEVIEGLQAKLEKALQVNNDRGAGRKTMITEELTEKVVAMRENSMQFKHIAENLDISIGLAHKIYKMAKDKPKESIAEPKAISNVKESKVQKKSVNEVDEKQIALSAAPPTPQHGEEIKNQQIDWQKEEWAERIAREFAVGKSKAEIVGTLVKETGKNKGIFYGIINKRGLEPK